MLKGVSELLNRYDQDITLDDRIQNFKQSALEEDEEPAPEPEPEPKERTITGLKLTEGLGLTETGIRLFVYIDWKDKTLPGIDIIRVP